MNKITIKKVAVTSIIILGSVLGSVGFTQAADVALPNSQMANDSVVPARLNIPIIGVDALINPMGITKNGAMEAPVDAKSVGWFALGPIPGDVGTAVIDGHYGIWKNGNISVFNDLNKLKPGDKIYIENEQGVTITFVVRELRTYDRNADTTNVFTSSDEGSHLNIIACAGIYNKTLKTYSNRLVVFADKE